MRGVAITGIGLVSALGSGVEAHLSALRSGRTGLAPLTLFELPGMSVAPAGQVARHCLPDEPGLGNGRSLNLALVAAREALATAPDPRSAVGGGGLLAVGTTTGGIYESEQHYLKHRGAVGREDRALLRHHAAGTVADGLALALGLSGERQTFSTACSSSANAIGFGAARVAHGAPWALVGGVDSLSRLTYCGFHSLKLLSEAPCRPFDLERRGLSLGEAAAFLLLEPTERAQARGVTLWGEVAGWGCTADAHHITSPHPEGLGALAAMRAALSDAGLRPSEIDYVNAHGTATPANDLAEGRALSALFDGLPPNERPWVSSTKGATGHTLGAAGALEAAFCMLALSAGFAPPTVGLRHPDPAFPLRHVPIQGAHAELRVALSNSFGFGGNNAALVLTRAAR